MKKPVGLAAQLENMTANKLMDIAKDENQPKKLRTAAERELSTRSMAQDTVKLKGGGDVTVVSIGVGKMKKKDAKKLTDGKTKMADGGMAYGKKHMYAAGGSVTMNPGLKALKAKSPEAFNKITGN